MTDPARQKLGCGVCLAGLGRPVYVSDSAVSVTSLCELVSLPTQVYYCERCGHVQTPQMANIEEYYAKDYRILIDSEDEDQLYQLENGNRIYRSEHQAKTLLEKHPLAHGARVLDYGCAKAATVRRMKQLRPDLQVHLFDVSEMYIPFWRKFTEPAMWSVHQPSPAWAGRFDLVSAFYSFEHMPQPRQALATISNLLAPGGIFYGIVPNWTANTADFVVIDHIHHFSAPSLERLAVEAGLDPLEISDRMHQSAWVMTARKSGSPARAPHSNPAALKSLEAQVKATSDYWGSFRDRVRAFEEEHRSAGVRSAIYGSGFYGTYIATCLKDLGALACFLDQNPYRQGKSLLDKPVVAPSGLPADVNLLYVGLNPLRARAEIAKATTLQQRPLEFFLP